MEYFVLSIILLLLGAFCSLFIKENLKIKACTIFSVIALSMSLYPALLSLFYGKSFATEIKSSLLFGNFILQIDPLSAIFILIISIMGFLGLFYANGYLKQYLNKGFHLSSHCFFLMLLIAAMLMVTVANHGFIFLISWEIMSLSSFFLVIFEGEKPLVLKSGIKYLIYMHLSVIFLILAFAILTTKAGSFDFTNYATVLANDSNLANIVFFISLIGFGLKAGFVPFHNWLPDAHPAAPTHVSAIMSGVMIKTGIYGILRILYLIKEPTTAMGITLLVIGVITALYGILYATTQQDIKKLLAYSSIENIGIIAIAMGIAIIGLSCGNNLVAILGLSGAIFHALNHSVFKELLFFSVGNIYQETHSRNIELMGGLIKKMPYTSIFFVLGSAAICGLPMFNGFVGELLIYVALILGLKTSGIGLFITIILAIGSLALVGTIALLCFTKLVGISLLGLPRGEVAEKVEKDAGLSKLIPMGILTAFIFLIALFPQYAIKLILCPVSTFVNHTELLHIFSDIPLWFTMLSHLTIIFFGLLAICLIIKKVLCKNSQTYNTWGCGYNKTIPTVQYTASSYVNPFVTTLKPLFKRVAHIKKPKELFPKDAYYKQEIEDIEEAYIVEPIVKFDEKLLAKFERIQNGNIQQYILFGLVFLILSIIGLIFIG